MRLKFKIDMEYDLDMIVYMLRREDWEQKVEEMGLPAELVKKVNEASKEELKEVRRELKEEVKKKYLEIEDGMGKALVGYQESWDKIIDEFSKLVEEKTVPWFYDDYVCKLIHYQRGLCHWGEAMVARWWREDYDEQRRITAHELLLTHFYSVHENLYKDSGLNDEQMWALSEIFAFSMTGLDEDLRKYWEWDNRGYMYNHNHPEIVELQKALKEPFIQRKDFNEYVLKGIELVKELYEQ